MALYVKDPEVDALAERLMALRKVNKTEAVRQALLGELERESARPDLVEQSAAFSQAFMAKRDPDRAAPADKAFIDGLYEDD